MGGLKFRHCKKKKKKGYKMSRIKQVTLLQPSSSRKEATFDNQTNRLTFPIPYKAKLKSPKSVKKTNYILAP